MVQADHPEIKRNVFLDYHFEAQFLYQFFDCSRCTLFYMSSWIKSYLPFEGGQPRNLKKHIIRYDDNYRSSRFQHSFLSRRELHLVDLNVQESE